MKRRRLYFDYAASTPVDKRVEVAMAPYFSEEFGNPSSLHFFGQEAMAAVDRSRETIACAISADFREIIFTGSATEANNLALRGVVKIFVSPRAVAFQNQNIFAPAAKISFPSPRRLRPRSETEPVGAAGYSSKQPLAGGNIRPRIIVSSIEHESVLETAKDLESEGVEVVYLPVQKNGLVDLEKLKESLNERTVLVSVMYANNEIGTIQPIKEISKTINEFKERIFSSKKSVSEPERAWSPTVVGGARARVKGRASGWASETPSFREEKIRTKFPLFHTDAVQAFQFLKCNANELGVDLMTLSAHKIYGPKGIGVLYARNWKLVNSNLRNKKQPNYQLPITNYFSPIITGGGQEFGLRSGTENVAAIVGFAKAVELVSNSRELEHKRIKELSNYFWDGLKKIFPKIETNGKSNSKLPITNYQLPNILNIYFPGYKAEDLLIKMDMAGIAISAGSACSVRSAKPSHVLEALGLPRERIHSSVRFSFGRFTTKKEIDEALKRTKQILV